MLPGALRGIKLVVVASTHGQLILVTWARGAHLDFIAIDKLISNISCISSLNIIPADTQAFIQDN